MHGMDAYRQIVYSSKATHPMSTEELTDILAVAQPRNLVADITGILLYRNGDFLQVLEGPVDALSFLLEKLNRDSRHSEVRVLLDGQVSARAFGAWSMAF